MSYSYRMSNVRSYHENHRPEALKKLAQLQIEKLKREEEEEQWISGEELYTEGSSDEDDSAIREKKRGQEGKKRGGGGGGIRCNQMKDRRQGKYRLQDQSLGTVQELENSYYTMVRRLRSLRQCISKSEWRPAPYRANNSDATPTVQLNLEDILQNVGCRPVATAHLPTPDVASGVTTDENKYRIAVAKMKRMDTLLEIADRKGREAVQATLESQLYVRAELEKLYGTNLSSKGSSKSSVILQNVASFYRMVPEEQAVPTVPAGEKPEEDRSDQFIMELLPVEEPSASGESGEADPTVLFENVEHTEDEDHAESDDAESDHAGADNGADSGAMTRLSRDVACAKKKENFILRNIKLAADGMGTLSITDEEKQRLVELLKDVEDSMETREERDPPTQSGSGGGECDAGYTMDSMTRESLDRINSQLEVLSTQTASSLRSVTSVHTKLPSMDDDTDDPTRGWRESQVKSRLQEIDSTLSILTLPTNECVEPLAEEELHQLVQQCGSLQSVSSTAVSYMTASPTVSSMAVDQPPATASSAALTASTPMASSRSSVCSMAAFMGDDAEEGEEEEEEEPPPPPHPEGGTPDQDTSLKSSSLTQLGSDIVAQLLQEAHVLMPNYRFRYSP